MVFTGQPVDYMKFRHVGIECYFVSQACRTFFHSKGRETTRYTVEERPHYDGATSLRFARSVVVGQLQTQMTRAEVQTLMFGIDPDNIDGERCQVWVGRVLTTLVERGLLLALQTRVPIISSTNRLNYLTLDSFH